MSAEILGFRLRSNFSVILRSLIRPFSSAFSRTFGNMFETALLHNSWQSAKSCSSESNWFSSHSFSFPMMSPFCYRLRMT